jgi:Arc/MetJ family transcription regulator
MAVTVRTWVALDQAALALASEALGTATPTETVNAALLLVGKRPERLKALAALGAMADRGDFDDFLSRPKRR